MAAATARTPARSLHGCWTCRARKKKCDETHPYCNECTSLGLECHGYGPRPGWMDNGPSQKEQALKFKHMVSQTKSKKGKPKRSSTNHLSDDGSGGLDLPSTDNMDAPPLTASSCWSTPAHPSLDTWNGGIAAQDEFHYHRHGLGMMTPVEPAWSAPGHLDSLTTESAFLFHMEGYAPTPPYSTTSSLPPGTTEWESVLTPDSAGAHKPDISWNDVLPQDDTGYTTDGQTMSNLAGLTGGKSRNGNNFPDADTASNSPVGSNLMEQRHAATACSRWPDEEPISWPIIPCDPMQGGIAEDTLFMRYLDHVFHAQFPFYHGCHGRGRGWLFSILRRVKPAYHATLALSERDILSASPQSGNLAIRFAQLRTRGSHHDLAVKGMRRIVADVCNWNGHACLIRSLEGLTTILQLLFWEISAGGTTDWQSLLHTAADLIPVLAKARMPSRNTPGPIGSEYTSKQLHDNSIYPPEDDVTISVLLGSFISLDILACASTRGTPFLEIDHTQVLGNLDISLETLMGCSSSVMALILEVSQLDMWKKEAQAAHRLSIADLARRGGQIEQRLQQELTDTKNTPSTAGRRAQSSNPARLFSASPHRDVSQLFALAAVTYLHVVVSGAHPELPEIAQTVSKTIHVFNRLDEPRLLQSAVWPFCVSGCLARPDQQSFFRGLLSAAKGTKSCTGTLLEAYSIIEECWEARKTSSYNCDWASVMSQCGRYVLLR